MIKNRKLRVRNILAGALSAVMVLSSCPSTALATDEVFFEDTAATDAVVENAETVESAVLDTQSAQEDIMSAEEDTYELTAEAEETESEAEESLIVDTDDASVETLSDGIELESEASDAETVDEIVPEETSVDEVKESEGEELLSAAEDAEESDALVEENLSAAAVNEEITAAGQRNFFYTNFTAELSDITVKVAASNLFVGRGATMSARLLSGEEYIEKIEAQNYGKILVGPRAIELTFYDAQKNEFTPIGLSVSIEAKKTDAESYALYRAGGNTVRRVGTSAKPAFEFYTTFAETYILSGLKKDDVLRAEGKRVNGKTTFALKQDGTDVSVSAPSGAFYGSISMEAEMVSGDMIKKQVESVLEEGTAVESITAYDISFHADSKEDVAPNKEVTVTIKTPINEGSDYKLIHIPDEGEGEPEEVTNAVFTENGVTFSSKDFSVYAVVEEGNEEEDSRLVVNFYGKNNVLVKTYYVKKRDVDILDTFLVDPGVGTLATEEVFRGWSIDTEDSDEDGAAYTVDTPSYTIDEVRSYIKEYLNSLGDNNLPEGKVLDIYGIVFGVYQVTYLESSELGGAVLQKDVIYYRIDDESHINQPYTINLSYYPEDPETQKFEGWLVQAGQENISPYNAGVPIENGTTVIISGNVTLGVDVISGNWLSFVENGQGAQYTPPQFLEPGEFTVDPYDDGDPSTVDGPSREGYQFAGWYTGKPSKTGEDPTGELFEFGNEIDKRTILYAKWVENPRANYTVVIWKERMSDTYSDNVASGKRYYDFYKSYTFNGLTGQTISVVTNGSTSVTDADGTYNNAHLNGTTTSGESINTDIAFTGFHKAKYDTNVRIKPEGNAVLNVYYDRNTVTYTFYTYSTYTVYSGASGWGDALIRWATGLDCYIPNESGGYERVTLYYNDGKWYKNREITGWVLIVPVFSYSDEYTGIVYVRDDTAGSWNNVYQKETGLYGESLNWPAEPGIWWYPGHGTGETGTGSRMTYKSDFIPLTSDMTVEYYGVWQFGSGVIRFYTQDAAGGNNYTLAKEVGTSGGPFSINDKFTGFTPYQWRTGGSGSWKNVGELMTVSGEQLYDADPNTPGFQSIPSSNTIEIRFNRVQDHITFLDGTYVNGNNIIQEENKKPDAYRVTQDYNFGVSVASYNENGADYYIPDSHVDGYVFAGWYADDTCTVKYDFGTMPVGGITVYAKWIKKQYRVFTLPMTTDTTLEWGDGADHSNSFRVDYGTSIDDIPGKRVGYELAGWYTDPGFSHQYVFDTVVLNDSFEYFESYDRTEPTELDKYGNPSESINKDAQSNRFWIDEKLTLYARWRKTIEGADGIQVIYDPNDGEVTGSNAPTDSSLYKDLAVAVAGAASSADDPKMLFQYWVLQKWDNDTGEFVDVTKEDGSLFSVYPGKDFEVMLEYAHQDNVVYDTDGKTVKSADYTVQLRAKYDLKESPTDTHIIWYGNGGTNNGQISDVDDRIINGTKTVAYIGLNINESIPAAGPDTFIREGYKFIGWGREEEPEGAYSDKVISEDAFTSVDPDVTLWLKLNEDGKSYTELDAEGNAIPEHENITEVAADEAAPYHALYAVWEPKPFYVVHSGTGAVEAVEMSALTNDGTYNITGRVAEGFLYGGYYKAYGGVSADDVKSKIAAYEKGTADLPAKVEDWEDSFVPYTLDNIGKNPSAVWNSQDTYSSTADENTGEGGSGTAMRPLPTHVYYLKEVPDRYLRTSQINTYHRARMFLRDLILCSTVDDENYKHVGFTGAFNRQADETLTEKLEIEFESPTDVDKGVLEVTVGSLSSKKLTSGYVFDNTAFRLADADDDALLALDFVDNQLVIPDGQKETCMAYYKNIIGEDMALRSYWVTPDSVKVTGIALRKLTVKDANNNSFIDVISGEAKDITHKNYASISACEAVTE